MYACVHGHGDLIPLAAEFSPVIEATGPNLVTFDVSGLDRLLGLPHDIATAIARRAGERGVQATLVLAANRMRPFARRAHSPVSTSSPMAMKASSWQPCR